MYYLVEVFSKNGFLAGQRTTIGLGAAILLRDSFQSNPDFGEVNIYSTEVVGGLIDKGVLIHV